MLHFSKLTTLNYNNSLTTTLEDVLAYKNKELIFKFCETYNMTTKEAEEIFDETKKFLYLCSKAETINIAIYQPMLIIDEMWHTFILFTKSYNNFCIKYFGHYIHHLPTVKNDVNIEKKRIQFTQQLEKIVEIFDEDTLIKWYYEYAKKYSVSKLNTIRKAFKQSDKSINKKLSCTKNIILHQKTNNALNIISNLWKVTEKCQDCRPCGKDMCSFK